VRTGILDFEFKSKNDRWFVWAGRAGFGFRLGRVELQCYVYGRSERP
jgi:hypothetical protein